MFKGLGEVNPSSTEKIPKPVKERTAVNELFKPAKASLFSAGNTTVKMKLI